MKKSTLINDVPYLVKDLGFTDTVTAIPEGWRLPTKQEACYMPTCSVWTNEGVWDYQASENTHTSYGRLYVIKKTTKRRAFFTTAIPSISVMCFALGTVPFCIYAILLSLRIGGSWVVLSMLFMPFVWCIMTIIKVWNIYSFFYRVNKFSLWFIYRHHVNLFDFILCGMIAVAAVMTMLLIS